MKNYLALISIVVHDYDEAIQFYTEKLNFTVVEDIVLSDSKRWVVVAPAGSMGCKLLLAKAANDQQLNCIGNQTGGRVFLFLHTDDFWRDHKTFTDRGVLFVRDPIEEMYGTVAVFKDLYGNLWDLIEPKKKATDSKIINQ